MAFEYERQLTKITHINFGQEKHGDQDVNTLDIDLRYTASNQALAMFSPTLKSSLYEKEDTPQGETHPDADHLTVVKNPKMGAIKWDEVYDHARVVVHIGASGKADVVFTDAKVRKWLIDPKQGGTVVFCYQVRGYPRDGDLEKIGSKLNQEVFITLDPEGGHAEDQSDLPDTGKGANEIAQQLKAGKQRAPRQKKQPELVE